MDTNLHNLPHHNFNIHLKDPFSIIETFPYLNSNYFFYQQTLDYDFGDLNFHFQGYYVTDEIANFSFGIVPSYFQNFYFQTWMSY